MTSSDLFDSSGPEFPKQGSYEPVSQGMEASAASAECQEGSVTDSKHGHLSFPDAVLPAPLVA